MSITLDDPVHHPAHYTRYGVEVIDITRHLGFCLGNAVKYVLRAPFKDGVQDCDKALQYLDWEGKERFKLRTAAILDARDNACAMVKAMLKKGLDGPMRKTTFAQCDFLSGMGAYIADDPDGMARMRASVITLKRALEEKADALDRS